MFTIARLDEHDFWIENEQGTLPICCLNRSAAEMVAVALNRLEAHQEVNIVIGDDKPLVTPGRSQPTKTTKITLDGYKVKPQKQLVIAVRDEKPAPAPKPGRVKVTL